MRKLKYITWGIGDAVLKDLKISYDAMIKPKQLMKILFVLAIVQAYMGNYIHLAITTFLYFSTYIWKIIKQGDWKHRMREDYIKH